ncbi:hypothetical protein Tco_1105806 [Tanacetum coccineum]
MEFRSVNRVMLKSRLGMGYNASVCGKLNPRYVGPFKVLAKVGKVAYKLELPQELSRVQPTFLIKSEEHVTLTNSGLRMTREEAKLSPQLIEKENDKDQKDLSKSR